MHAHPAFHYPAHYFCSSGCRLCRLLFQSLLGSSDQEKNVIIVLKSNNVRSDFWQTVSAGAEAAAKEGGAALDVQGPLQESDTETQIQILEEAITQKPAAIVVAPINDERILAAIAKIRQAGIPIVVIDTPLSLDPPPVSVSNNHLEAGRLAGVTVAKETKIIR